jgi:hypothetical protein
MIEEFHFPVLKRQPKTCKTCPKQPLSNLIPPTMPTIKDVTGPIISKTFGNYARGYGLAMGPIPLIP